MEDVFLDTQTHQQAVLSPQAQPPSVRRNHSEPGLHAPQQLTPPAASTRGVLHQEPPFGSQQSSGHWDWQPRTPERPTPGQQAQQHFAPTPPQQGTPHHQATSGNIFSTGPLPSRPVLGEDFGAAPDERKFVQKPVPWGQVMCMGFVVALFIACLPVVGGIILLQDPTYRFWAGVHFPWQLIGGGIGSVLLLGVALLALTGCASEETLNSRLLSSLAASFSSLMGVLFVLSSISASSHLYSVSSNIDGMGCRSSLPELIKLMDYSVVLYNLRMTPACFAKDDVTSCSGWRSNDYTRYLKHLEEEYDCGPLCAEEPAPQVRPAVPFGRGSLLDEGHRSWGGARGFAVGARVGRSLRRRGAIPAADALEPAARDFSVGETVWLSANESLVREQFRAFPGYTWHTGMADMLGGKFRVIAHGRTGVVGLPSPDGSQRGVWYFPAGTMELAPAAIQEPQALVSNVASLKLFSQGSTSMTCLPIISTRLRVLAYSFGDLLFWQGLLLLVVGILCSTLGLCCGTFDFAEGGRRFPRKA